MSASTAAAALALMEWQGRDPQELQAILKEPLPDPPLVRGGAAPPAAPPQPGAAELAQEQRVSEMYDKVKTRREAFPQVEQGEVGGECGGNVGVRARKRGASRDNVHG